MRKTLIAAAILAMTGTSAVYAQAINIKGDSTNTGNVKVATPSNFPPLAAPLGYSGLEMRRGTAWSGSIDIYGGPITQVSGVIFPGGGVNNANLPGPFYANFPLIPSIKIAQVWLNNQHSAANIYSLRQVTAIALPSWPQFGGLVVGQVAGTTKGSGVYFGEWSHAISSPSSGDSTNLNMADASRTAWYVGDNATTTATMPATISSTYAVVGINQTGRNAAGVLLNGGLPHAPNLYTGNLTVSYGSGSGTIIGSINRTISSGTQSINFAGTTITSSGAFNNSMGTSAGSINGQFYNNANALAGIYRGSGAGDHVAFGGKR